MKRLSLLLLTLFTFVLTAQAQQRIVEYRVQAGMNVSKVANFGSGDLLPGFRLGASFDLPLTKWGLDLRPGLFIASKGEKVKFQDSSATIRPIYLEIPIQVAYTGAINSDLNYYIAAGPYLAIGVGGKFKPCEGLATVQEEFSLFAKGKADKAPMNRFDMGLMGNIGLEFSRYFLEMGASLGLLDAVNPQPSNYWSTGDKSALVGSAHISFGVKF